LIIPAAATINGNHPGPSGDALRSIQNWLEQGNALFHQQQWAKAAAAYREVARLDPNSADAWRLLGLAQQNASELSAAEESFARCLALAPGRVDATICYAFLLNHMGQPQRAVELLEPVLANAPLLGVAWLVLGNAYQLLGAMPAAIGATRQAVKHSPGQREVPLQLADLLLNVWALDECEDVLRRLLAEHPTFAAAWSLLGICLRSQARHNESLAALRQALALDRSAHYHSKYLAGLQYVEGASREVLLETHQEWNRFHGCERSAQVLAARPRPAKLRLGFVSADFGSHPIGYLALAALERLDKRRAELFFYSDRARDDQITARFRQVSDAWRSVRGQTDEQLAEQIRGDGVHILFDLAGHFNERFTLFRHKPAPVQITWLGYVGTTGLATMDFLLADRFHVAPGEEHCYSERVLRMSHGYACYCPPSDAPDVAPLPALARGHVTLGCFNNPAKYSPRLLDAWGAILRDLPSAQLLLKFGGLDQPRMRKRLSDEFQSRGIGVDCVLLEPMSPHHETLAAYGRVDLALDTQPYSGGLTTCEALWMGVPVVAFPGRTFAGRHSTSHLTNAGLSEFVAADWESYVELAVRSASDLPRLASWRTKLRGQVQASPLCDAPHFAEDLLSILERCWTDPLDIS
jgi:protein O-GlcNAc transferase